MTRAAYFDCFAGVSGDMLLGALLSAGLKIEELRHELETLELTYELSSEEASRCGIAATRAVVKAADGGPARRTLADIKDVIDASVLLDSDKQQAMAVFSRLAEAEAEVHGAITSDVHFHEVGAVDAIVDIVGAVVGLRLLGVERVFASPVPLGSGTVKSAHGILPVPVPAALALVSQNSIPTAPDPTPAGGELSTPTGLAILATLATFERSPMTVERVGYGAGSRDPGTHPNVVRVWLGQVAEQPLRPTMLLLETNIDDMPAEQIAYAMEKLLSAGAADAWFTPIQMKKGRPAVMLSALCSEDLEDAIAGIILAETTTLGLRVQRVSRHEAERELVTVETSLGPVRVKVKRLPGRPPRVSPEFEDCRRLAEERDLPLQDVMALVQREAAGLM
ncbi:MAG: nickel pincer cofactor biosynthesis protein LarC [Dehalococcoidia bacterium]